MSFGCHSLDIYDHGGVRSERKKWITSFPGAHAALFTVDVTCWGNALFESNDVDEMAESQGLFDAISNSRWFENTKIILVFTNYKALARKLRQAPLEEYFPDYVGGCNMQSAFDYISRRFIELVKAPRRGELVVVSTDIEDGLQAPAKTVLASLYPHDDVSMSTEDAVIRTKAATLHDGFHKSDSDEIKAAIVM